MNRLISFILGFAAMAGVLSILPLAMNDIKPDTPAAQQVVTKESPIEIQLPSVEEVEQKLSADLAKEKLATEAPEADDNTPIVPVQVYIKSVDKGRTNASLEVSRPLSQEDQMVLEMMGDGDIASADDVDKNWNDDNLHLNSEIADEWSDVQ